MLMPGAESRDLPGLLESTGQEGEVSQFAESVLSRLFALGSSLDGARSIVGNGPAGEPIAAATGDINRLIRDIRTVMFRLVDDRPAALQVRLLHTAQAMQVRALETVALLEREASRAKPPIRLDFQTEIKRWRGFADNADQIARRWEQQSP
jgi:hypothetical protein